jgi:hypothetical protein
VRRSLPYRRHEERQRDEHADDHRRRLLGAASSETSSRHERRDDGARHDGDGRGREAEPARRLGKGDVAAARIGDAALEGLRQPVGGHAAQNEDGRHHDPIEVPGLAAGQLLADEQRGAPDDPDGARHELGDAVDVPVPDGASFELAEVGR